MKNATLINKKNEAYIEGKNKYPDTNADFYRNLSLQVKNDYVLSRRYSLNPIAIIETGVAVFLTMVFLLLLSLGLVFFLIAFFQAIKDMRLGVYELFLFAWILLCTPGVVFSVPILVSHYRYIKYDINLSIIGHILDTSSIVVAIVDGIEVGGKNKHIIRYHFTDSKKEEKTGYYIVAKGAVDLKIKEIYLLTSTLNINLLL